MPKATDTHTPPAAPLVSGKDALAAIGINPQSAGGADQPDAELLKLCREYGEHRLSVRSAVAALRALPRGHSKKAHDVHWAAMSTHQVKMHKVADTLFSIRPVTADGIRGKIAVLRSEIEDCGEADTDLNLGFADKFAQDVEQFLALARPEPNSDAELIALCEQYVAAERQIVALYDGPEEVDEDQASNALSALGEKMRVMIDRMEEVHAQTPAGIHARARALTACNPDFGHSFEAEGTFPYRLLAVLMRDAMAVGEAR